MIGSSLTVQKLVPHCCIFPWAKPKDLGTGLGLSSVYGIIQQHKGRIWVNSEPDQGTTLKVYLPMTTKAPMTEESKPVTKMPAAKETILVVEDEDAVRSLIKDILERVGYRVMATGNPDAAESIFEEHQDEIELLVSDVVMPGKSGPELYRRLSQQKSGLYVLFISGYTESGVFDRSELNEHSSFIQKPFRPTELVQRVREILDR